MTYGCMRTSHSVASREPRWLHFPRAPGRASRSLVDSSRSACFSRARSEGRHAAKELVSPAASCSVARESAIKQTAHVEAGHRGRRRKADRRAAHARRVHDWAQGREHHPPHRAQRVARARAPLQEERQRRADGTPASATVVLEDLTSYNGVFVNGLRVTHAQNLRPRRPRPDRRLPHRPAGRGARRGARPPLASNDVKQTVPGRTDRARARRGAARSTQSPRDDRGPATGRRVPARPRAHDHRPRRGRDASRSTTTPCRASTARSTRSATGASRSSTRARATACGSTAPTCAAASSSRATSSSSATCSSSSWAPARSSGPPRARRSRPSRSDRPPSSWAVERASNAIPIAIFAAVVLAGTFGAWAYTRRDVEPHAVSGTAAASSSPERVALDEAKALCAAGDCETARNEIEASHRRGLRPAQLAGLQGHRDQVGRPDAGSRRCRDGHGHARGHVPARLAGRWASTRRGARRRPTSCSSSRRSPTRFRPPRLRRQRLPRPPRSLTKSPSPPRLTPRGRDALRPPTPPRPPFPWPPWRPRPRRLLRPKPSAGSVDDRERALALQGTPDSKVLLKHQLEQRVNNGKASDSGIRLLIGTCKDLGDRACVQAARAALAQKQE